MTIEKRNSVQHTFSTVAKLRSGESAQSKSRQQVTLTASIMSGEAGIRTLGLLAETPVFKTGAIGHSATSPAAEATPSPTA